MMVNIDDLLGEEFKDILRGIKKKPKSRRAEESEKEKLRRLGLGGESKEEPGKLSKFLSDYLINELIIKDKIFIKNLNEPKIFKNNIYNNFEKDIFKPIIKNYSNMLINKNFSGIYTSPLGLNLTLKDSADINADNIGEFALPIVEYIHQTQPDYVVASDRGARLLGLAIFRLYRELYGRFPTADGTLRFRRFSKSNSREATEKHLKPLVNEMLHYKKRPTVLVLDDWVCSGGTKQLAQDVFLYLGNKKIKVKFGVLVGGGADVSGQSRHTSGFAGVTDWRDDSDIIGVRYGKDNWGSSGVKAKPARSEQARDYRRRMYEGIDRLVKDIAEKGKEALLANQ